MNGLFQNLSPEQLLSMREDAVRLGKVESFDASAKADGLTVATPPTEADAFERKQYQSHGVEHAPKPEMYRFQWSRPLEVTPAENYETMKWAANAGMPTGWASSLVSRFEELAPAIAKLSDQDRAEAVAKAQAFVGEQRYGEMMTAAKEVLASGGATTFKLLVSAEAIAAVDVFTLRTLAGFQGTKAALATKLAEHKAKGVAK